MRSKIGLFFTGIRKQLLHAVEGFGSLPSWKICVFSAFFFGLCSVLVVYFRVPDGVLYLGLIPIVLAALHHRRRITYICTASLLVIASVVTVHYVSTDLLESLKTIMLSSTSIYILAELVYSLQINRKRAEKAEHEASSMLAATLDAIPDVIGIQGKNHEIIGYNAAGYAFLNKEPDEVIGKKCYQLIGRETPCEICATRIAYETKKPAQVERYEPHLDVWLDVRTYPIFDENGEIIRLIEHLRDITETKNTQRALDESRRFLQNVFNAIGDGICVLDKNRRIVQVNRWVEDSYADASPLIGKVCNEVFECRGATCETCPAQKVLKTGDDTQESVPYKRSNGKEGWLEVSAYPLEDAEGNVTGVIEYLKDITARRKTEEEREALQSRLVQSQKMEAVGRLAGGIAHDFNNMLTAIRGNAEFVSGTLDQLPRDEMQNMDVSLSEVISATDRAQALTGQLLSFSRKHVERRENVDLGRVFSQIEPMIQRLIGSRVEIQSSISDTPAVVHADLTQIEQVILNLALNARDAMADGGRVYVDVSIVDGRYHPMKNQDISKRYVVLTVRDTGKGIPEEALESIFEPFYTTKEQGEGTGLGLATVYAIVDQMGGFIDVDSWLGKGSVFKVYLPESHDSTSVVAASETRETADVSGTERILLVEDEAMVNDLVSRVLERNGYEVTSTSSPVEGLRTLEISADYDLLITDVIMPEMSGLEFAKRLPPLGIKMPVLFMSGFTDESLEAEDIAGERVNFIQKPFSSEELLSKVRNALETEAR